MPAFEMPQLLKRKWSIDEEPKMGKSVSIPQAAVALLPLAWGYERDSLCETVSKKKQQENAACERPQGPRPARGQSLLIFSGKRNKHINSKLHQSTAPEGLTYPFIFVARHKAPR